MDRKWKSGAAVSPPSSSENSSDGYPTAGNPGTGTPATTPGAYWHYMVTEELRNAIAAGGLTPNKAVITQLRDALQQWGILGGAATLVLDLSGATGGQIKFPATQNPSANGNTFDDFERGQCTPGISGTGGASGVTYGAQAGRFWKFSSLIVAIGTVTLTNKGTITGNLLLTGLPYVSASVANILGVGEVQFENLATAVSGMLLTVDFNVSHAVIRAAPTGASAVSTTPMTAADLNNTSSFSFVLIYPAAT